MDRETSLQRLSGRDTPWDMAVIGGGATLVMLLLLVLLFVAIVRWHGRSRRAPVAAVPVTPWDPPGSFDPPTTFGTSTSFDPPSPFSLPKLMWQQRHQPGVGIGRPGHRMDAEQRRPVPGVAQRYQSLQILRHWSRCRCGLPPSRPTWRRWR